jgi:hypothetical protein
MRADKKKNPLASRGRIVLFLPKMEKIFLIERSPDVFRKVQSYLEENSLPFVSFQTIDKAVHSDDFPLIIILFGSKSSQEIRQDLSVLKNKSSYVRIPKILILPLDSTITEEECRSLGAQEVFSIPVERLKFQTVVSNFLMRAPRRVFRILVTVQKEGSNIRYSGSSIDFSESGMAFESTGDFAVGERIFVSFVNPRSRNRFLLKAEVVRRTATPTGTAFFYGVGFREMSEKETRDLSEFISG